MEALGTLMEAESVVHDDALNHEKSYASSLVASCDSGEEVDVRDIRMGLGNFQPNPRMVRGAHKGPRILIEDQKFLDDFQNSSCRHAQSFLRDTTLPLHKIDFETPSTGLRSE